MVEQRRTTPKPEMRRTKSTPPPAKRGLVAYLKERHDPLTGLLLTIPVFLLYHLGILAIDSRNGVDFISTLTFELLERSLFGYVLATIGYAAAIGLAAYLLRRRGTIKTAEIVPVLGESLVLAIIMLFLVGWATNELFDWQVGGRPMNPIEKLVMAAGAGFHEELVFRVGLFAGGAFLLRRIPLMPDTAAAAIAAIGSSIIFSIVHYIPPYGDPVSFSMQFVTSFTFRILAGLFLVAVYRYRGFAVAVYTHTIYDLIVFFVV